MKEAESLLYNEFEVELLKRYLNAHPQESMRIAIASSISPSPISARDRLMEKSLLLRKNKIYIE